MSFTSRKKNIRFEKKNPREGEGMQVVVNTSILFGRKEKATQ